MAPAAEEEAVVARRAHYRAMEKICSQFRDQLLALYQKSHLQGRKNKADFVPLLVPVASCAGFAVVADDGPGPRKLVEPGHQAPVASTRQGTRLLARGMANTRAIGTIQSGEVDSPSSHPSRRTPLSRFVHVLPSSCTRPKAF